VDHEDTINAFLQQRMDEQTPADSAWDQLQRLTMNLGV
jgi:flagellum-specific ATP synthase